jgi:hypothetical protein
MGDVFTGYQNLPNGTLDVVVHEWALDLNIGLENLSFRIVGTSIMMHSRYLETSTYVLVMHVISNKPSTMCKANVLKCSQGQ